MGKSYLRKFIPLERTIKNNKCKFLSQGKKLTKKHEERLQNLYIPPAYQNLLFAKSPNNKVQVIGEDVSGRKQYIYNSNHTQNGEKRKYLKLQPLIPIIQQIEIDTQCQINNIYQSITISSINSKINSTLSTLPTPDRNNNSCNANNTTQIIELNSGLTKTELIQIIIYLLIKTNLRIGCMKYCKLYNSYGLTTIQPQHLNFGNKQSSCQLKFIGKKGVENTTSLDDTKIITILHYMTKRVKNLQKHFPDANHLFQYIYYNPIANTHNLAIISSQDVMAFFENHYNTVITPKMFRTWYANYHMLNYLKELQNGNMDNNQSKIFQELKESNGNKINKYLKKEIPIYVSQKLNNTPNVCKNKYMNNLLFNNIVENPNYYLKKINKTDNVTQLLQSLLSK